MIFYLPWNVQSDLGYGRKLKRLFGAEMMLINPKSRLEDALIGNAKFSLLQEN